MAFATACSLEAPTTEAGVDELIDITFAELNRRVGRAGFSAGQRVFGRQLRLPSSLLEHDFIDPYTIMQDANHEMRQSEAMRMTAAGLGFYSTATRLFLSTATPFFRLQFDFFSTANQLFVDCKTTFSRVQKSSFFQLLCVVGRPLRPPVLFSTANRLFFW